MPKKLFNKPEYTYMRKKLRQTMVHSEVILWDKLRGKQLQWRFRRQHGIGKYIVDFFNAELQLAIEIDGISHEGNTAYTQDAEHQRFLEEQGITVLRFTSSDIFGELDRVLESIGQTCYELS